MKYVGWALSGMLLIALGDSQAAACVCYQRQPPCVEYWQADAVFVGLATQISPHYKDFEASSRSGRRTVILSVQQAFRGVTGGDVTLESPVSDCEIEFEEGKQYFVYAYRDKASRTLGTSACSRTMPVSSAVEDLAFVRALSEGVRELLITGVALKDQYYPVPNVRIAVEGTGKSYKAITDDQGRFSVGVIKPGSYNVRITLPSGYMWVGYQGSADNMTGTSERNGRITLDYRVEVSPGKCAFIDVSMFLVKRR